MSATPLCWRLLQATPAALVLLALCAPARAEVYGGVEFPLGAVSFADRVVRLQYNDATNVSSPNNDGTRGLGTPDATAMALGNCPAGGESSDFIVEFLDNRLVDVVGPDLYIFERGSVVEASLVYISADGDTWYSLGEVNGGTDAIDLADFNEVPANTEFRYVRLRDKCGPSSSGSPYGGPDIDAIGAIGMATDDDMDGVAQHLDNCPMVANASQRDADNDGVGDACDYHYKGIFFPWGGDSFADRVQSLAYNDATGVSSPYNDGSRAVGPPDSTSMSLGNCPSGGESSDLVLEFFDNRLVDHPNSADLYIFESGNAVEGTLVSISADGLTWYDLGEVDGGTDAIDLADFNNVPADTEFRYVRLRDKPGGSTSGSPYGGPDIDAVAAIGPPRDDDMDGFTSQQDNCPMVANPDQADADGDGAGDACDYSYDGVFFPRGPDSFADRLISLTYNDATGVTAPYNDGGRAIGPPDNTPMALGNTPNGGTTSALIVEFVDNRLIDNLGDDLYIFEIGPQVESTTVDISIDGVTWYSLGTIQGSTRGVDLANFNHLPPGALFRFVRLGDAPGSATSGAPYGGPDIDAVAAISTQPAQDSDSDGLADDLDNCPMVVNVSQLDSDGDGVGDACDPDLDGDGVNNDVDNCPSVANPNQADNDMDDLGDACDSDDDNDGRPDTHDNCPLIANADQLDRDMDSLGDACDADSDNDGVPDDGDGDGRRDTPCADGVTTNCDDNCLLTANPDQADANSNGRGDACDADTDGDGVGDVEDNCPMLANPDQADLDGDGPGDACDGDDDGDQISDGGDNCPRLFNLDQADTDTDGMGDACDGDDDGDGVLDLVDNCPLEANPDQADANMDGMGDACDASFDTTPPSIITPLTNGQGFDAQDPLTWAAHGAEAPLPLQSILRDVGSGLRSAQVELLGHGTLRYELLAQLTFQGQALLVPNATLCARQDLCSGNALDLSALPRGAWTLRFTLVDRAGLTTVHSYGLRSLGLREALVETARQGNAWTSQEQGLVALRDELVQRIQAAVVAFDNGYYGNIWLAMEDASSLQARVQALGGDLDLGEILDLTVGLALDFQGSLNEQAIEQHGDDDGDDAYIAEAMGSLTLGHQQRQVDALQDASLEIANSYFWQNLIVDPRSVGNFSGPLRLQAYRNSQSVTQTLKDELDAYIAADEDLPGRAALTNAAARVEELRLYTAEVVRQGDTQLDDLDHAMALLTMTSLANELKLAEGEGAWVRNWQWALVQLTVLYAERALFNASTWIGNGGPIYARGQERFEAAEEHRLQSRVDDYMNTLIASRCLVVATYNGIYDPDLEAPMECCALIREYNELDARFPVPDQCLMP